jgi:hypothetical protein
LLIIACIGHLENSSDFYPQGSLGSILAALLAALLRVAALLALLRVAALLAAALRIAFLWATFLAAFLAAFLETFLAAAFRTVFLAADLRAGLLLATFAISPLRRCYRPVQRNFEVRVRKCSSVYPPVAFMSTKR